MCKVRMGPVYTKELFKEYLDNSLHPISEQLARLENSHAALQESLKLQLTDWLNIENAALVCDCSYDHIYRAVERGDLPATNIGTGEKKAAYRISRADLQAWLERRKSGQQLPSNAEMKQKMKQYLPGV